MNFKSTILIGLCLSILAISAEAQRRTRTYTPPKLEDLPKMPVDTIDTSDPDTKIVIYTNNTWSYYRPIMSRYNELPVYSTHWDTTQIFSYKDIALETLPNVVELSLITDQSEFHYPYKGFVRSKYGIRRHRNHNGVDIPLKSGDPLHATFDGKVRYAKFNLGGYGNLVIIRHKNGLETWYAHMSLVNVKENDYVKAGQIIGFGGNTGRSTGPHLHYEMRYCDQSFDPEFLVDFLSGNLKSETFALSKSYFNIHSRASEILLEDDDLDEFGMDPNIQLLAELGDSTAKSVIASADFAKQQAKAEAARQAKEAQYHVVRSGDILGRIATKYGVSIDQICRLNNIKRTTVLQLGRRLRVK